MTLSIIKYCQLLVACMILQVCVQAQNVGIRTDKNQILIGERVQYDLLIRLPGSGYTFDVDLPETIPHFEVISRSVFDTSGSNNNFAIHQAIIFTSFDSGQWYIPSFPVTIQKGSNYKKFLTDSVLINVGYSPADSTNQLRDIKPVMEVTIDDYFWWYVAAAVLLALLLAYIIYRFWKKRKQTAVPVFDSPLTPYEEAKKSLEALSGSDPGRSADLAAYHTQLSLIIKRYYSRVNQVNLLNKTTGDFLLLLKEEQFDPATISSLAGALRIGDAVKFAKFVPPLEESRSCREIVGNVIEFIHRSKTK